MIDTVAVTRYVTPLREGGSLPGVIEGDDLGTYVCKFRGAGQGVRVLVAEVIVSALATRLGLLTPRLVALELDPEIARYEADEEVQDLLNASAGLNLGIDFLPGAFGYEGEATTPPETAARILWLDAFTANVDRTWRNPNLLLWHGDAWVIDHGAALYFHHAWPAGLTDPARFATQAWDVGDHVFGALVDRLPAVDGAIALSGDDLAACVAEVPDAWLEPVPGAATPEELRAAYVAFLSARLATRAWLPGVNARVSSLPYQYVVLRCVPRVDREEFLNVGVVLYCEEAAYLDAAWSVDRDRLGALAADLDLDAVCEALDFVSAVCSGEESAGAPASQPPGMRFGFLKAPRSTVLQPGPVHGGVTTDPGRQLEHLLERFVG